MALYVTREGGCATANAWANLTTFGGQTFNNVFVPNGYGAIKELWVSAIPNGGCTDTTGATFCVRLTGNAIKNGPADFVVGGFGSEITGNDSVSKGVMAQVIPVDIGLNGGSEFVIQGMQFTSADMGAPDIAVTVVMTKGGGAGKRYVMRNGSLGAGTFAVDTKYVMTSAGDQTLQNAITIPGGCTKITKILAAFGGLTIATAAGGISLLRLEGTGLKEGEVVLPVTGIAGLSTTTGVTDNFHQAMQLPTDIDVNPGGYIWAYMEQTGVAEPTTAETGVSLELI